MVTIKRDLGDGGSHITEDLRPLLTEVVNSLNSLKTQVDDLQEKFNAHTHTENSDAAYTQNASTAPPASGQQSSTTSVVSIQN